MNTISHLIFWTLLTGILSAFATGLGALPFHYLKKQTQLAQGISAAIAAGMMISASIFSLISEGFKLKSQIQFADWGVLIGFILGLTFIYLTSRYLEHHANPFTHLNDLSKKSIFIFLGMFVHSIPEGIAIGVGFATGHFKFGLLMALAISIHNIPEGIAISLPLKSEGASTRRCFWLSVLSSAPQPIMAVPSALLAWLFIPILPIGLGFAAGAMMFLTFKELLPEAYEQCGLKLTSIGTFLGIGLMLSLTFILEFLVG